ncbi:hypothetical protein STRIP9103_07727 [Streptomyces ipomoeae 91-03]|uniref:Uncharacterized protein n=1 Tax=Streptomyces ipomoeae 91-03 TaxID=698759 RepID=L1KSD8_9ACTN|nr:hypothetical protein STRIP9103_07727 [Streptomyces ipomoeae 91-03]
MDLRGVAAPGTPSRRTGHKPKYIQYEGLRPARREHAPPLSASLEREGPPRRRSFSHGDPSEGP